MSTAKKGFDCVQMKHDIQERIYEETKDLSPAERVEYFQRASERFRKSLKGNGTAAGFRAFLDALPKVERRYGR